MPEARVIQLHAPDPAGQPGGAKVESTARPLRPQPQRPARSRPAVANPVTANPVTAKPVTDQPTPGRPKARAAKRPAPAPERETARPAVTAPTEPNATILLPTAAAPLDAAQEVSAARHPSGLDPAPLSPDAPSIDSAQPPTPTEVAAEAPTSPLERKIAGGLAFLRRRITGDYDVDEFGFDSELVENVLVPAFQPLYQKWFRTEVLGIENIPAEGGALLVANHAGGIWALDGAITTVAVHAETPGHRNLRMLGADLIFTTPGLAPLARKSGATLACNADAERLLAKGELVGVWPEGFKGIGKPFSERYKLQRFGRGGFVTAALRAGVPIIPISIVGSEEIHPVLGNAKTLARLLNLPYFPITPTFPWLGPLGLIPFPSKWYIEFGEPIETANYGPEGADDPMLVFELTDRVRETIQSTLYRLLVKRRSVWR
ncbi:1-acyl-sn-glycerol-3-phosphate acyltransferase [Jatrophihabitans sp. GAS493]|uniref:lysophospholipid acyltransferase family protein n=1 Tax=Jatrophihabitans sp. GAS493 TaxID=1907575 RepID=UPI000BBF854B|nr:lysophospholipid acyltransferase family protein [Jatrophihabitans sp. GAS493]SOD70663.1 1-acyl-sn-glycerol-3-phosphate acyltransferase [Jatrophihabitans sp. GAS493]